MPDSRRVGRSRIGRRWSAKAILCYDAKGTGVCVCVYRISQEMQVGRQTESRRGNSEQAVGMKVVMSRLTARRRGHHDQMVKVPFSIFYQLMRLLFRSLEGELEASCCTGHDNTKIQKIRSAPSIQYISW